MEQSLLDKLTILADSAKYDVACTSSGASRTAGAGGIGSCYAPGCCHAFTADGRCVSLLKVLMTAPLIAATASTAGPTMCPGPPLRPGSWPS